MTRTRRSSNPRALIKDRSLSRSGLDSSIRKGGAGAHSWGSLADERKHELDDIDLVESETETKQQQPVRERRSSTSHIETEEERQRALKLRKGALKSDNIDLAAIARSSAAVTGSPPQSRVNPSKQLHSDTDSFSVASI